MFQTTNQMGIYSTIYNWSSKKLAGFSTPRHEILSVTGLSSDVPASIASSIDKYFQNGIDDVFSIVDQFLTVLGFFGLL